MSARVLTFIRDGRPARLVVNSPEADRLFALLGKLVQLERDSPRAGRVVEQLVDDLLEGAR